MTIETANIEAILGGCFIRSTTAPKGPWTQFTQHRYHLVQSKYGKTQHVRHVSLKVYCRVLTQHTLQNRLVYTSWHLFQPSAFVLAFDFPLTQITLQCFPPCGLCRVTLSTLWPTQRHISCSSAHSQSNLRRLSTSKAPAPLPSLIPADMRPPGVAHSGRWQVCPLLLVASASEGCLGGGGAFNCDLRRLWQHDICWQSSDLAGAGTSAKTAEAHRWQLGPIGATPHRSPAWWQARGGRRTARWKSHQGWTHSMTASVEYRHQQRSLSSHPISNSLASLAHLIARESSQLFPTAMGH